MSMFNCIVFGIVAASLTSVHALSDEERTKIHESLKPVLSECGKNYGVTQEDIMKARADGDVGKLDPCFFACYYKKTGFFNDKGLFDSDAAVAKVTTFLKNEEDQVKAKKVADACLKVNDVSVSDGEQGCERARVLFSCLHEHIDQVTGTGWLGEIALAVLHKYPPGMSHLFYGN